MPFNVNMDEENDTDGVDWFREHFRHSLRSVVDAYGGNQAFSEEFGVPLGSLNNWLRGKSEPRLSTALALWEATGFDVELIDRRLIQENVVGGEDSPFALIPRHEVSASAGPGLVPVEEGETELMAFRRDWLHRIGVNPRQAALIVATGDSMEPSIPDGAIMLLDTAITEVRNGWICAIVRDGELLVKRIQKKLDGSVLLISDNERYQAEEIGEDRLHQLHIAGRVRWVGRAV